MGEYPSWFTQIAETTLYLIWISVLVVLTSLPIITLGTAIASGYRVLLMLPERENSMEISEIINIYFKCYVKRLVPTTLVTMSIMAIVASIIKVLSLISFNMIFLTMFFIAVMEVFLFLQVIYILLAENYSLKYFDSIRKTFYLTNYFLPWILLMMLIMIFCIFLILIFRWSIIIMPGLYLKVNLMIYDYKIKPKIEQ